MIDGEMKPIDWNEATCKDCPKLKELDSMNANINNRCIKMEGAIRLLQEENARLKAIVSILETAQPKWISVKDRLPDILEQVIIFYGNVFYCVTYYGETECWGVCENVKFSPNVVNHWMPLPPPPTTEESSATEKENG